MEDIEIQIARWRTFVTKDGAVSDRDAEELEGHLRDQIGELTQSGLAEDEAYLIAVKRLGSIDELTREFAHEHMDRLWKQLLPHSGNESQATQGLLPAFVYAVLAAVAIQVARLAMDFPDDELRFGLNVSLVVLPFLAAYFTQRRGLPLRGWLISAAPFAFFAILVNAYPFDTDSDTAALVMLHLPIVLWFAIGIPYMNGSWRSLGKRMDFVRFTGEWLIYYTLIALGGGVLLALTGLLLQPLGDDLPDQAFEWLMPSGAAAAVVVAAWLVEAKQRIVENMAPVLTWVFTPLFAVMLVVAAVTYAVAGIGDAFDRDLLTVLDALLVVVLGLVIYGLSAREPSSPPALMDIVQLAAVVSALLLDLMVLGAMFARIEDLGFTPNRAAVLGLNLLLFVNLARAAGLALGFIRKRVVFDRLTGWQLDFLPVFAIWASVVVIVFPPAFGFN